MKITWDALLERIRQAPLEHLGSYSPRRLRDYFFGYAQALFVHAKPGIEGECSLREFNEWFIEKVYRGPQGWASYCLLLTKTPTDALDIFFEFREMAKESGGTCTRELHGDALNTPSSALDLIRSEGVRKRASMYFAYEWLPGIWAFWNGYVWAENDIGIKASVDRDVFTGFQKWLRERYRFAEEANFGKLFDFLALDTKEKALENFYDHLELFQEGAPPNARIKRFQTFLDEAVASALKEQEKQRKNDLA